MGHAIALIYNIQIRTIAQFNAKLDYYKILNVLESAKPLEIKKAYYKMAQKYHPDKTQGKTTEKFKEISEAYEVLSDST